MFTNLFWACGAPQRACGCEPSLPSNDSEGQLGTCSQICMPKPQPSPLMSESQVLKLPPKVRGQRLTVPNSFTRFQFSVIYTQLGATQGTLMEQQRSMLQSIVRHFTSELQTGVVIGVLDGNGRMIEYLCHMEKDMTQMVMQTEDGSTARPVVFTDIERVCSPEEVRNLRATTQLFIDECCTTVILTGQRCVTLKLDSVAAREYVMLCLQVLRMSQDRARMWYA